MRIGVVSGGFDPLHTGHIRLINEAAVECDKVVVALNSDEWLTRKKGKPFMEFDDRATILENLANVYLVVGFNDDDDTCIDALETLKKTFPKDEICFCNGGDRDHHSIPEIFVPDITFRFGVGGHYKLDSSSRILEEWKYDKPVHRGWGSYNVLFEKTGIKLKELVIEPGESLSYQKHYFRSEIWFVQSGVCEVRLADYKEVQLKTEDVYHVPRGTWHQIINTSNIPCHIIEIQYGEKCEEEDIERAKY
jgi:cytidyltransferase-like protein